MSKKACDSVVLVTGAAGFLGKVVIEDLVRRRDEFGIKKIVLLLRPKRGKTAQQRFEKDIATSECFKFHFEKWTDLVEVISGDLLEENWGSSEKILSELADKTTHIIHCAASIDFNLPLLQAARSNIASALSVLEFAKRCPSLRRFVDVSTAYVRPHQQGTLEEKLVPLPKPATKLYQSILDQTLGESEALAMLGHPNTYTLTKCLAEHLLVENRAEIPLTIVRPSIISVAETTPFPGWIDSYAALAGFFASYAAGYLRVISGKPDTRLDVVPVDRVARIVADQTFASAKKDEVPIVHAVAGLKNALPIGLLAQEAEKFFARYPQKRKVALKSIGPHSKIRELEHLLYHRGPLRLARVGAELSGQKALSQQAAKLDRKMEEIFRSFPYFTHRSFDFAQSVEADYSRDPVEYILALCKGTYQHLLRQDPHRTALAGSRHTSGHRGLLHVLGQPRGNETFRATAVILKKALDQMFTEVSFDQFSFERARAQCDSNRLLVIVPSHRSYADFMLCSYIFFARPELGVDLPYIAAAKEFSSIPALGRIFKRMRAFYLKRNSGSMDPELMAVIEKLVKRKKTIQFFIEGQRSRSRRFLPPKRGLLRSLQNTGQEFDLLPVSISYDHVPEEAALLSQMKGYQKEPMRLRRLVQWAFRSVTNPKTLGHVQIRCGAPLRLGPDSDVRVLSDDVIASLQKNMPVSTYHLECFLKANPKLGIHRHFLERALERRGATLARSDLHESPTSLLDSTLERSFRMQWLHFFANDAIRRDPANTAVRAYLKKVCHLPAEEFAERLNDEPIQPFDRLLAALFKPICMDYAAVAKAALKTLQKHKQSSRQQILDHAVYLDRPTAEVALMTFVDEGLLIADHESGLVSLGADPSRWESFVQGFEWKNVSPSSPVST